MPTLRIYPSAADSRGRALRAGLQVFLALLVVTICVPSWGQSDDGEDVTVRVYDKITMNDDKVWEGEVVEETPLAVSIQLKGGRITHTLMKEDIKKFLRSNPASKVYERRNRRLDHRSGKAHFDLAVWCLSEPSWGLWQEARLHLEQSIRHEPERAEAYDRILELYDRQSNAEKDLERRDAEIGTFWRGLQAGIDNPDLARRAAEHLEELGDLPGAIDMYQRLLNLDPDPSTRGPAEAQLARLLEASGQRERAQRFVESLEGEPTESVQLLQARWLLEGVAAGDRGASEALEEVVQRVLASGSSSESQQEAHLLRACALLIREDFETAAKSFQSALQGLPTASLSLSAALYFSRVGDHPKALLLLSQVRNVIERDPGSASLYRQITAYMLENEGKTKEALTAIQGALHDDAVWQTWMVYVQTMDRLKDDADVPAMIGEILSRFPNNPMAFAECALFLGDYHYRQGDGTSSRRWLEYAREVLGDDPELLIRLGMAHLLPGGLLTRAGIYFERAQESRRERSSQAPASGDLRNGLGCVAYRQGDYIQAESYFRSVVKELSPGRDATADESKLVSPALEYAKRALRQVDGVLNEELWLDEFARDSESGEILNNWAPDATVGVDIRLEAGSAVFDGRQRVDGMTLLQRGLTEARLSRYRVQIRLVSGADDVEVALRLEHESGVPGLVFFRAPDGVLGFVLNQDTVVRSDEEDESAETKLYGLTPTVWPADGKAHQLEIRQSPEKDSDYEIYFDGKLVAGEIRLGRARGGLLVGVSGRADAGVAYRFEIDRFEIYRRKLKVNSRERR